MQTLCWKLYYAYAIARAYYVGSLKATLRYYYFKDREVFGKVILGVIGAQLVLVFLGRLLPPRSIPGILSLLPMLLVLPHLLLLVVAEFWEKSSRARADRLKAWCQEP
jgi:hypothetical protein